MIEAAPDRVELAALIRSALANSDALKLGTEQLDKLSSLFCSVCGTQSLLEQRLARREDHLTRAVGGGAIEAAALQAIVDDANKCQAELEARTAAGFASLREALTGEQFSALLAYRDSSAKGIGESSEVTHVINAYLDEKIKNKEVVEVELAAKVADRIFGWVKLFGFFVAAPVSIVMVGLSIFGISQVSDIYSHVTSYKTQLEDTLKSATQDANAIKIKVAELEQQSEHLRSDVTQLQECVFGEATKAVLANALGGFRNHMVQIGFASDAPTLTIEIEPKNILSNAYSYYDPDRQRIVLSSCAAGEAGSVFHEYSHYVLLHSIGFDVLKSSNKALFAIENGLASYFACSYQNDPVIGRPHQQTSGTQAAATAEPLINLENRRTLAGAGSIAASDGRRAQEVADAWGGLFWDIRKVIGADQADRILLAAWRALPTPEAKKHSYSAEMAAQILSQVGIKAGEQKENEVRDLFKERALEF